MRLHINAYDILGVPLVELRGRGWHGARRDVHSVEEAAVVLDQHSVAGREANLLVNAEPEVARSLSLAIVRELGGHHAIEVGNEWDREKAEVPPAQARDVWDEVAYAAAQVPGVTVVTGGISSLSSTALSWLQAALPEQSWWPAMVCGFHGYTSRILDETNRRSELMHLRSIIGARPAWNTETGWHQASKAKPFPLCWQREAGLTEEQVLANLVADVRVHEEFGIEVYTVYQISDGPQDKAEDRFGIRAFDGRWKLQASLPTEAA